jgi:hypothetical protein
LYVGILSDATIGIPDLHIHCTYVHSTKKMEPKKNWQSH